MIPVSSDIGTVEKNNFTFSKWTVAILVLMVVMFGLTGQLYGKTNGSVLLLQQTPTEGGEIAPGVGVHRFEIGSRVTLTAVPEPGYEFVYWIGDVSDATANNTIACLDTPKIIIAVFEKARYDYLPRHENELWAYGNIYGGAADYTQQGGGGLGGQEPRKYGVPERKPGPEFPVPEPKPESEFPVPIPEPATGMLLGLGSLLFFKKTRRSEFRES